MNLVLRMWKFCGYTDKLKVYISLGLWEKLKLYYSPIRLEFWCVCMLLACVRTYVCGVSVCAWRARAYGERCHFGHWKEGSTDCLSNQSWQQHSISSNPTVIETVLYESCAVNVVFIFFLFQPEWIQVQKNSTVRNCSPFLGHQQMNMSKEFMTNGLIIMTRY